MLHQSLVVFAWKKKTSFNDSLVGKFALSQLEKKVGEMKNIVHSNNLWLKRKKPQMKIFTPKRFLKIASFSPAVLKL